MSNPERIVQLLEMQTLIMKEILEKISSLSDEKRARSRLLTTSQVAEKLGKSRSTIIRMINLGILEATKLNDTKQSRYMVSYDQIRQFKEKTFMY